MATREEIREWLECCGASNDQFFAYNRIGNDIMRVRNLDYLSETAIPIHLLNPQLTGIQGPTFAEWKKQKGRDGKAEKVIDVLQRTSRADYKDRANKILDAIEGEG